MSTEHLTMSIIIVVKNWLFKENENIRIEFDYQHEADVCGRSTCMARRHVGCLQFCQFDAV